MSAADYPITFGYRATDGYIDPEDRHLVKTKGVWVEVSKDGYVQLCWKESGKRKREYLHRIVVNAKKGDIVDHINQNRLDNRRENLRIVTAAQNVANSKLSKRNTSNYRNVYWQKNRNKWFVQLVINKTKYFFGYYTDIKEAFSVADCLRDQLYGKYKGAMTNE